MNTEPESIGKRSGPTVLRFEAMWLNEAHFSQVVQDAWDQAGARSSNTGLAGKLALVHDQLHKWDHSVLQNTKKRICSAQRELERAASGPMSDENSTRKES